MIKRGEEMKKPKAIALFLILCSVIFVVMGIFAEWRNGKYVDEGIATEAEIVRVQRVYDSDDKTKVLVYVEHTVDGVTYTGSFYMYTIGLSVGNRLSVLYMPDDPSDVVYNKINKTPQTLCFIGAVVLFGLGGFVFFSDRLQGGRLKRWKESGQEVEAVIKKFDFKRNTGVLGKHPATLVCEDPFGNVYEAKFLFEIGTCFDVGDPITVYVDGKDLKKYKVDVQGYLREKKAQAEK